MSEVEEHLQSLLDIIAYFEKQSDYEHIIPLRRKARSVAQYFGNLIEQEAPRG